MRRIFSAVVSAIGGLLVFGGVALLAYVGLTYAQQVQHPTTRSVATRSVARHLTTGLSGHQNVAVPRGKPYLAPGAPALRIVIPAIGVDSRVRQTAPINGIWNVANWAVGHLSTTPGPGLPGNGAYAAHDDIKGEIFKRLGELRPGNLILLYSNHAVYRYVMTGRQVVNPSNVSVLNPTSASTITLITCTPYWIDTQRIVVKATLQSSSSF